MWEGEEQEEGKFEGGYEEEVDFDGDEEVDTADDPVMRFGGS